VTTVLKLFLKPDDGGRGCQKLSKTAFRHLWTAPNAKGQNFLYSIALSLNSKFMNKSTFCNTSLFATLQLEKGNTNFKIKGAQKKLFFLVKIKWFFGLLWYMGAFIDLPTKKFKGDKNVGFSNIFSSNK
jgi:hypothetical protein